MKTFFRMLPLLCLGTVMSAQSTNLNPTLLQTGIKAAYQGSLLYPGFKLGIEHPYKVIEVNKTKKWGTKTILKERYLTANLGYYHHETFHDNLYLLFERQKRRQHLNGWFTEHAPGIGYSRTFLGGTTYAVSDQDEVTKKELAGYNYALVSFALGAGYNFAMKEQQPLKIYGKASMLGFFPHNSSVYLRPTVEIGVVYAPQNFWKANPKLKIKQK
jgi:hypothetical protein